MPMSITLLARGFISDLIESLSIQSSLLSEMKISCRLRLIDDLVDAQPSFEARDRNDVAEPVSEEGSADRRQDRDPAFFCIGFRRKHDRVLMFLARLEIADAHR